MKIHLALLTAAALSFCVKGQVPRNVQLWPNASIPVDFDPKINNKTRWAVHYMANYWERRTCLRFLFDDRTIKKPRLFVNSDDSLSGSAELGVINGGRLGRIYLGTSEFPVKGVIHEMMHVFGWLHTQERSDSHLYLKNPTLWDETPLSPDNDYNYGVPYDHSSSATYDEFDLFDPKYRDSMRSQQTTSYDILQVNLAYKCFEKCDKQRKPPPCQNGGVVDVNNCSKCYCPRQYSGDFCQDRSAGNAPRDCGKTIPINRRAQKIELPVKPQDKHPIYYGEEEVDNAHCYYRLKAPPCKRIKVTVRDAPNLCHNNCQHVGLEVFASVDKRQSGYRYCCTNRLNETVISTGNELMLDAYTWTSFNERLRRWNTLTFKIDVVAVD